MRNHGPSEIMSLKVEKPGKKLKSTQIIVGGFLAIIFIGAFLLWLPISTRGPVRTRIVDAFFTATSAVCVTGMAVVNTRDHWTVFGQIVIAVLVQIGGLGFMTLLTTVLIVLGKKITLKERLMIQESLNQKDMNGMVRLVQNIVIGTFAIEGIGAFFLTIRFFMEPDIGFLKAVFMGVFHSITAFCNAGFDIVGPTSLSRYLDDPIINIVIVVLMNLGGIGFAVWLDLRKYFKFRNNRKFTMKARWEKLSLNSKISLEVTAYLIIAGFLFILLAEYNNPNTLGSLTFIQKLWASSFQAISLRTAGFATFDHAKMTYGSKFFAVVIMFIGGSPGGTASGLKTVSFAIIVASVISVIKGRDQIVIHNKSIPFNLLQRALSVALLNITMIVVSTIALTITESSTPYTSTFLDMLFEATSAVGTVGASLSLTTELSDIGRMIICVCMFVGRLGPVSIAVALGQKLVLSNNAIHYPEEKVLVG